MISNAYNYYLSAYGNRTFSRHDSHKRSELRDLYKNIINVNKAAPLYKIDTSESTQKLAIDIKESARALTNVLDNIDDMIYGRTSEGLIALCDNSDLAEVTYVGLGDKEGDEFTIDVKQLATPQINTGEFLSAGSRSLLPGTYSFNIEYNNQVYEIDFSVNSDDTNGSILAKLSDSINKFDIPIRAGISVGAYSQKALTLTSYDTGTPVGSPVRFNIVENNSAYLHGAVSVLGINRVASYPGNAVFEINGNEKISESNQFMIDDDYEVTLTGTSDRYGTANIQTAKDGSSVLREYNALADAYNSLLSLANSNATYELRRLGYELGGVIRKHSDELAQNGIIVNEDMSISVDSSMFSRSASQGQAFSQLNNISELKDALKLKTNSIELNPIEFVNKKIVAYKNPHRPTPTLYSASAYSGMMFDYTV